MSFDFLGTFTGTQFNRFSAYLRDQVGLIDERILHLEAERERVGNLGFAYDDGGVPTQMNASEVGYVGKLFRVYEALGGDAEFDLQVRSTSQAVFKVAGDEAQNGQLMSNGEVIGQHGLADAETALLVQQARSWVQGDLHRRRESLERKIRRMIDYAEQLQIEINELQTIREDATVDGALEFLLAGVQTFISDRQYQAVTNDAGAKADPHGKLAKAPFATFTPGGEGLPGAEKFERTHDGAVKPGESVL